ncbi:MAG: twin-arginine translocase subunit TatC [Clostridiales bacterium]|nr:twin-arginine translocase subunit TatC [Clostridiales bacterium]
MDNQDKRQSILEHLTALRNMLVISAIVLLVAFTVIFSFGADTLIKLLQQPILERGISMISIELTEPLLTKIKISLIAAAVVSCPVIIWQVWRFISPALYRNEKLAFWLIFLATVVLFLLGVVFCYGAVYVLTVEFFIAMGDGLGMMTPTLGAYIDYLFSFVVPFGLAFELPVVLYITTKMGLTNYQMLASKRKYIVLGVAIVAAILTPPDVVSQIMLIIPILLLFEVGLLITRIVKPKTKETEEE